MTRWQRGIVWLGLVLAWTAVAFWQYHEYGHERHLADEIEVDGLDRSAFIDGIAGHVDRIAATKSHPENVQVPRSVVPLGNLATARPSAP